VFTLDFFFGGEDNIAIPHRYFLAALDCSGFCDQADNLKRISQEQLGLLQERSLLQNKMDGPRDFRVGLVGAGIGGLAAAIAIARAGAQVTVLEAAEELGEVGSTKFYFSINLN
jgi:heterodisulfide reductase subunit A-like polyferredoxin